MDFHLTDEELEELLKAYNVPVIKDSINYWFVRTSAGEHFEDFYFGHYIAIGWDKLNNLEKLKASTRDQLKEEVSKLYKDDSRPGNTASQILKFVNDVKIGDYILIPNASCERISIGIVTSDVYLYEPTDQDLFDILFDGTEIDFLKRRNVKWITKHPLRRWELDPLLLPIIYSYGTIVDANPYSQFINRSIYDMYYRNGELHTVFNMTKPADIPAYYFNHFISSMFEAQKLYSSITNEEFTPDDIVIKASFNSAGPVELITTAVSGMIILSSIALFINGANLKLKYNIFGMFKGELKISSPGLLEKIKQFKELEKENKESLEKITADLNEAKEILQLGGKDILKTDISNPDTRS